MVKRIWGKFTSKKEKVPENKQNYYENSEKADELPISSKLETNLERLKEVLGDSPDLIIRRFKIGQDEGITCGVVLINYMSKNLLITEGIFKPSERTEKITRANSVEKLKASIMSVAQVKEAKDFPALLDSLLSGDTVVFVDGSSSTLIAGTRELKARAIEEPPSEPVIRGPREGFTEILTENIVQIRRRIKSGSSPPSSIRASQ